MWRFVTDEAVCTYIFPQLTVYSKPPTSGRCIFKKSFYLMSEIHSVSLKIPTAIRKIIFQPTFFDVD